MDCSMNIITANFSGGRREARTARRHQWDRGQVLCVTGIEDLPLTFQVHFAVHRQGGAALQVDGIDGQVDVPNILLTFGRTIYAWIYLNDSTSGETVYTITIPIIPRPMPEYYDLEDTGVFDRVVEQVGEYAEQADQSAQAASQSASGASGSATAAAASASAAETAKNAAETAQGNAEDAQAAAETAAQTATEKAQQSAQDAAQAALDAGRAESAAGSAEAAQTGAQSAKTDAETAAQGAAASASAASASATSARQAAISAGQSATAAAGSATTAGNAAQTATTKAGEASASATAANTAKTAAQTAQTGAETAATNAGQSASTATAKAAEAAQSATDAAASKTAAEAAATRAETAAASLTVDSALSDSSVNPVQNKVVTGAITDVKSAIDEIRDGYGKNLFNSENLYGVTGVSHANGIFSAKASDLNHFVLLDSGFDTNAVYTVSFYGRNTGSNVSGNGLGIKITYTNGTNGTTYLPNSTTEFAQYKLTSTAGRTIQTIEFLYNSGGANVWGVKDIQIEKGSSASVFVPFFTAYDRTARDGVEGLNAKLDDVSGLALSSGEISISSLTYYPDFNDFPLNRIVHLVGNILPENAPPGYAAVGHNNSDSGKYSALVMTYSAMTNLSTVVQKCIYYNDSYAYDKLPRTATRYARIVSGQRVWTDWSVMSENTVLHASDKVVDINSYQTVTFSDFNDAPVNAIYQVDLNVGDTILHNPSPGHSGLFMTFSFSPVSHHALVQHFYALESATEFVMYFRYGYKQSSADLTWTEWKKVATDIDGKYSENKGRIASGIDLNTLTDNAVYLMGYNYSYVNRPWESLAGFITTKTVGLITLQVAEGLDGAVKRRSTADGGTTWTAWE